MRTLLDRYHEIRAGILMDNSYRAWGILLGFGIGLAIGNLFIKPSQFSPFLFGLSQGFIWSAVIVLLVNLIFYFPKVGRLLKRIRKEGMK